MIKEVRELIRAGKLKIKYLGKFELESGKDSEGETTFSADGTEYNLSDFVITEDNLWTGKDKLFKGVFNAVAGTSYWTAEAIKVDQNFDSVRLYRLIFIS